MVRKSHSQIYNEIGKEFETYWRYNFNKRSISSRDIHLTLTRIADSYGVKVDLEGYEVSLSHRMVRANFVVLPMEPYPRGHTPHRMILDEMTESQMLGKFDWTYTEKPKKATARQRDKLWEELDSL